MATKRAPLGAEKPEAARAFEDYYALGEGRSLSALAARYRSVAEPCPTKRLPTLKEWSARFGWQQRVKDRDAEDAAEVRKQLRQRTAKFRKHLLDGLEADIRLKLQELKGGAPVLATDAAAVERLTKLYFQLAEDPLTDKHEVTGQQDINVNINAREELISRIAGLAARRREAGAAGGPDGGAGA